MRLLKNGDNCCQQRTENDGGIEVVYFCNDCKYQQITDCIANKLVEIMNKRFTKNLKDETDYQLGHS